MSDQAIRSSGVISVISNIVPGPVQRMVQAALNGDWEKAQRTATGLQPLFSLVTVKTEESSQLGPVSVRARNPLPIKTMMSVLGMNNGPCRPPLGRVTKQALEQILQSLRLVWATNPEFLEPIEDSFDVSIGDRLQMSRYWEGLSYAGY